MAATLDSSAETAPPEKDTTTLPPSHKDGEKRKPHSVALTFGPVEAIFGVAQVSVEGRLTRKFGLAGIVGGGSFGAPVSGGDRFPVFIAGISPRYYLVGDFDHGMQLGTQVSTIAAWKPSESTIVAVGAGSYIGYKYTDPTGFTLELRGGVGYASAFQSGSTTISSVVPLANINLGWAF